MTMIPINTCNVIFSFMVVFVRRMSWRNFNVSQVLSLTGFYYTALTFSMFHELIGYLQHFLPAFCSTKLHERYSQLKYRILKRSKSATFISTQNISDTNQMSSCITSKWEITIVGGKDGPQLSQPCVFISVHGFLNLIMMQTNLKVNNIYG